MNNFLLKKLLFVTFLLPSLSIADEPIDAHPAMQSFKHIEEELKFASFNVRNMSRWIIWSGDNGAYPFAIVDKIEAKIYVFFS